MIAQLIAIGVFSSGGTPTPTPTPITSVVSLADAKAHLRVTSSAEDNLIQDYIDAAQACVEEFTGLRLVPTPVIDKFSGFIDPLPLTARPVADSAVISLSYRDPAGVSNVIADSSLVSDTFEAWIFPASGTRWPITRRGAGAVTVTYTAGYTDPGKVPAPLKQAIKELVAEYFANRLSKGTMPDWLPDRLRSYKSSFI